MAQQSTAKKLQRSPDACLGGVCAGLAERYDVDAIIVRILVLIVVGVTLGLGALVYLALWALLPERPSSVYEVSPENAESSAYGAVDELGRPYELGRRVSGKESVSIVIWLVIALCLMMLFGIVVANVSPMVRGSQWWQLWPVAFIIVGVCLMVIPAGGKRKSAVHALGVAVVALAATCLPVSLGVVSWDALVFGMQQVWYLGVVALALFGVGAYQANGPFATAGAFVFALFCLVSLVMYAAPDYLSHLMIRLPDGGSVYVALSTVRPLAL